MKLNKFEPTREIQRKLKKSLFNIQLDYEIFSVENIVFGQKRNSNWLYVWWDRFWVRLFYEYMSKLAKWELDIDTDNSNTYYVPWEEVTVSKSKTPRWYFYNFYITFAGKVVNIFTIEEFTKNNTFHNEIWRFIFRWAFYYFWEYIPAYIIDIYSQIKNQWESNKDKNSIIKRTRVDVAFDFDCEVFNYAKYTNISSVSKTAVRAYDPNKDWLFSSFSYLPVKSNKWYGFRIYDKIKDTKDKNKYFWYWDTLNGLENWQRIEYEIYSPYSHQCTDEELFAWFSSVLLGTDKIEKKIVWKPKSQYNSENLLKNFIRYSKNHWVWVWKAMVDLTDEFFKSTDIGILEKLELFSDSISKSVEQTNSAIQFIDRIDNLEDIEKVNEFLKTEKWKVLYTFFQPFLSKYIK